ncbi:MAG: hypothetical protein J6U54_24240 [Clostridiales bacterium]|nr:hypothetical protein [Clostridiales bacterium]
MADNMVYEQNGYVKFTLNSVEIKANPRDASSPEDKFNRNFAGEMRVIKPKVGREFKTDERFANIIVPKDMVDAFKQYEIDMWENAPREGYEDQEPTYTTKIKLAVNSDGSFNPKTIVKLVAPKKRPVDLTEETIGILDKMHIQSIDVVLGRGREKKNNGKYQLWINTMYVYQDIPEDAFAYKFADLEYSDDSDDVPF